MIQNPAVERGFHHIALASVGSTNDEVMARARAGAALPLWVTAERQLKGRGRQGVPWTSESGNLYASLALRFGSVHHLGELPILASVALHDALGNLMKPDTVSRLAIKWPNDLLFDGRKISGILAESRADEQGDTLAVIGIGVNLAHHPQSTRYPATDLAAEGIAIAPADLFAALNQTMSARLAQWQAGAGGGFPAIRAAWLERVSGLGEPIEVRLPNETLTGRFGGMDESGRLILQQAGAADRLISAGEVFLFEQSPTHGAT